MQRRYMVDGTFEIRQLKNGDIVLSTVVLDGKSRRGVLEIVMGAWEFASLCEEIEPFLDDDEPSL